MPNEQHSIRKHSPGFVIPAGTQVVLQTEKQVLDGETFRKSGAVGIVAGCPGRANGEYLIEFADGSTVRAGFDELSLRRREVDTELEDCGKDLRPFIIYKCMVGSKAYGLDNDDSDDDIRGIYLPPATMHWSLYSLPGQIESNANGNDEVYWELEKFIRLALKANPNVLEILWTPRVLESSPVADELREIRDSFLSKHLFKTYSGYVLSQFRRMKNSVAKTGKYKKKHAMHLIRLLYSGIGAVSGEGILVEVGSHREELLNIRRGTLSFEEIRARAMELDARFQAVFETTGLPEQPDYAVIDDFLIRSRKSVA